MRKCFWVFGFLHLLIISIGSSDMLVAGTLEESYHVAGITIKGNQKTKPGIIIRELTFALDQEIKRSEIALHIKESKENLLNTSLFNFVSIDTSITAFDSLYFTIDVQERWYIWPTPILEIADRNFSIWLKEKNWDRINYGMYLSWKNFTGRKDELIVKTRLGYKEQYAVSYNNPYINKKKTIGVKGGFNIFRLDEIPFKTENDMPVYYKSQTDYANVISGVSVALSWRPHLYSRHNILFEAIQNNVEDTIVIMNPDYFGEPESEIRYFTAKYNVSYDRRDSKVYPLDGYYANFRINKIGLGFENNSINELNSKLAFIFFQPLGKKFYYGGGITGKLEAKNNTPYFLNRALGYNEIISGYELNVIDGQDYFISKSIFKFELIAPREDELFFPRYPQFNKYHYALYLNVNFDMGYVSSSNITSGNVLTNTFLYGGGIGLDWVSYYDIVFRIEASINKFGQPGIFIHYGSPFYGW